MANKISDWIKSLTGKTEFSTSGIAADPALSQRQQEAMERYAKSLKKQVEAINKLTVELDNAQRIYDESGRMDNAAHERMKTLDDDIKLLFRDVDREFHRLQVNYGIVSDSMENYREAIFDLANGQEQLSERVSRSFKLSFEDASEFAGNIGGNMKSILSSFGEFGIAIYYAGLQMAELNEELIKWNRHMSGTLNNFSLGMDRYGNGLSGSTATIAARNNISTPEFLKSFDAFSKGNVIGLSEDLNDSTSALLKYGAASAKLSKQYSVDEGILNNFTGNLVYNFGTKIEDLNSILDYGKKAAVGAGISVKEYFKNLSEASSLVGQVYIANGIEGMEKMAMFASKLQLSIQGMADMTKQFATYTDIYSKQNNAMALGLQSTAIKTAAIWAKLQLGNVEGANKDYVSSLASDINRLNYIDGKGSIDSRGLQTLTAAGASTEQIIAVQNLIRKQKDLGLSFDQLTDINKLDLATRMKIAQYDQKNATVGEKISMIWNKLKALIIDPLAALLAPVLDIFLNGVMVAVDVLSWVLNPVIYGFELIGKGLGYVSEAFSWLTTGITTLLDDFGLNTDEASGALGKFAKVIGTVIATIWTIAIGQGIWGALGGSTTAGGGVLNSLWNGGVSRLMGGGATAGAGGGMISGLLGSAGNIGSNLWNTATTGTGSLTSKLGVAGIIGTAGSFLSAQLGNAIGGEAGKTIGNVGSGASWGAGIGTMILPGIGTAVGAAVGAIGGFVYDSWGEISNIWTDGSGNLWDNLTQSVSVIVDKWLAAVDGMMSWISNKWDSIFGDDEDKKKSLAAAASMNIPDYNNNINKIMGERTLTEAFVAEKAQEKQHVQMYDIKVTSDFGTNAKAKVSGR